MIVFSIVIPVYNKASTLLKTLQSIYNQTFNNFEIIVINDGSTDGSLTLLQQQTDTRLHLYTTPNQGVSQARNLAIQKAQGQLIAFIDADDYWEPHHLQTLYNLYQSHPEAGIIATKYQIKYPNKIITPYHNGLPKAFTGIVPNYFASSLPYRITWTGAVAVPKIIFETIGLFNEQITLGAGEDTDMWLRIALQHPVAYTSITTATYSMEGNNHISFAQPKQRKFAPLDNYTHFEKHHPSLQKFLDIYRTEYALKHKLAADNNTFQFYKNQITPQNLTLKARLLFALPLPIVQQLYRIKKKLEQL